MAAPHVSPDYSQFQKFDSGKPRLGDVFRFVPLDALMWIIAVIRYGAIKYTLNNWKKAAGEDVERYEDALARHWAAWKSGEKCDAESKLPHLAHMGCNILFMIWHHLCKQAPKVEITIHPKDEPPSELLPPEAFLPPGAHYEGVDEFGGSDF